METDTGEQIMEKLNELDILIGGVLNKVKKLGWFLEVEYLCQKKEVNKAKKLIKEVIEELGLDKKDIDNTGYTKMIWNLRR